MESFRYEIHWIVIKIDKKVMKQCALEAVCVMEAECQ